MGILAGALFTGPLQALEVVKIEVLGNPDWYSEEDKMSSYISGISADGSVLVGGAVESGTAFSWQDGVWTDLGYLVCGGCNENSHALAVSADGKVIVGYSNEDFLPFVWENGMMTDVGRLRGYEEQKIRATAVSSDGSVIVGFGVWDHPAFRREKSGTIPGFGVMTPIGDAVVWDVSGDGSLILGSTKEGWSQYNISDAIYDYSATEPSWTELGLPESELRETAELIAPAISSDGSTAVGYVWVPEPGFGFGEGAYPVVCFIENGQPVETVAIPLHPGAISGKAYDVSADGSLILGVCEFPEESLTLWERKGGEYQPALALLPSEIEGVDRLGPSEFRPFGLKGPSLSEDGSTIVVSVGDGLHYLITLADTWGPYTVREDGYCDTNSWMGWLYVANDPWIWSEDLNHWIYCPGEIVGDGGGWIYVPK
jgi:probable HAF family extracellular repeat protein